MSLSWWIALFVVGAATTSPTTAPASRSGWAFRGGGALLGKSPDLPAPPMRIRWTYHTDDSGDAGVEGAAAVSETTAYVSDGKGVLHAIDLATGKPKWTYQAGEEGLTTTPLLCAGSVIVGDLSGVLHAVSADSGLKHWTLDTGGSIHASANAVAPDSTRIVIGNDDGKILCVDPSNGEILWTARAEDRVNSAAAIVDDTVYVAGCDAKLTVLNLSDGKPRTDPVDIGAVSGGSPAIVDDRIVIGTDGGRVLCLARKDASMLWTYDQIKDEAMVYASPAVSDGIVVIGARDRQVHAIELSSGKPLWTFKARLDVDSSPVVSGGRVYVGSKDKNLYVIDLRTGTLLWEFKASRGVIATPAIAAGVLVIGDTAGTVYCLESATR